MISKIWVVLYFCLFVYLLLLVRILSYKYSVSKYKETMDNQKTAHVKVALCISGQLRDFDECYPSIKKYILDIYHPDIFACFDKEDDKVKIKSFINKMNPIATMLSDDKYTKNVKFELPKNTILMFKKIYECNELKKKYEHSNNFKYDVVIRIRPDLIFRSRLPLELNDNDSLSIPTYYGKNYMIYFTNMPNFNGYGLCDQLAFGSSRIMDKYSEFYINYQPDNKKCKFPENYLKGYINDCKINIKYFKIDFIIFNYKDLDELNLTTIGNDSTTKLLNKVHLYSIDCYLD